MSTKKKSRNTKASLAKQLVAGAQKHLANMGNLVIAGSTVTLQQVVDQLTKLATLRDDVAAARATLKTKLEAEKNQAPPADAFFDAFVQFVRATFGNSADVLADFGLAPKKVRTPLKADQKAAAAAKRKSTLAARGIVGTRKRAAVKGNVTGLEMVPIVKGPDAPAQQAPNAPTNGGNAVKS